MVRNNVEVRPFVPRVYQRNVDIEGSLVRPCIADIDRRQGVVHAVSSLVEEKETARSDVREYERLCKQISQHRLRSQMEARAQEHDRIIRSALNASDMQRIHVLDGPFCRLLMPNESIRGHSKHAVHLKMMESRRLQDVHDAWEATKDDERRARVRKLFRPSEVTAIPEMPYHRAYRNPSKFDF
ncbi:uncharacterized protein LOC100899039 [Galendromus occidentalis]|uniref:Uncharacterized protein LOC100899039 n=1 Tax=Galendromus occidentalis TaxID=34638 RepID=A0AAJ6QSQ4_9ACAR|nr:uncharacterized protein LOC100899039 [Galendromus occidentalis]